MKTEEQAIAFAKTLPTYPHEGMCLTFVSDCYNPPADSYSTTAAAAYNKVPGAQVHHDTAAPAGSILYWLGGTPRSVGGVMVRAGHITISLGGGLMVSTDWGDDGYHGDGRTRICHIDAISKYDNPAYPLLYQGWAWYIGPEEIIMALTADDLEKIRKMVFAAVAAIFEGSNPAGTADPLLIPDTGSWASLVDKYNLMAIFNKIGASGAVTASGTIDYAALAKAVNDDAARRMAG